MRESDIKITKRKTGKKKFKEMLVNLEACNRDEENDLKQEESVLVGNIGKQVLSFMYVKE